MEKRGPIFFLDPDDPEDEGASFKLAQSSEVKDEPYNLFLMNFLDLGGRFGIEGNYDSGT